MEDENLTAEQVAEILKVKKTTVWEWCKKGTLPGAYKLPGSRIWRISKKEFEKQKMKLIKK